MKVIIIPNDEKSNQQNIKDAMTKIGGIPVFFHTIMIFESRGFYDFIICDTSEGHEIKDYLNSNLEKIKGLKIRLLKFPKHLKSSKIISMCRKCGVENAFFVAPNDVMTDLDPEKMLSTHRQNGNMATAFVAREKNYFNALGISNPENEGKMVNTGFYIFEPEAIDFMTTNTKLDSDILIKIAENDDLLVYTNNNFIQRTNNIG